MFGTGWFCLEVPKNGRKLDSGFCRDQLVSEFRSVALAIHIGRARFSILLSQDFLKKAWACGDLKPGHFSKRRLFNK